MKNRQIDRLLVGMQGGSNDDFAALYEGTRRGVYSFIYSYLHNHHATEDVMQTVYLKIKMNVSTYRPGTNGRAWILQIAKNLALSELEKMNRIDSEAELPPSEDMIEHGEVTEIIKRVLTNEEERIVVLHVIWGYKHREISRLLGLPLGTVTSKYKRATEKVRKEYEGK